MLHPYLRYYTLRSVYCRQIANYFLVRATRTAVQQLRFSESAGRQLSYWKDGYTKDSTCSFRAVTGNSGEYISALPFIFFSPRRASHALKICEASRSRQHLLCLFSLSNSLHCPTSCPPTDSKIEIDRMQRFHCYTSCSPDSDSGGHALIAHQFPQLFHFTRKTSTKTALPTH